MTPRFSFIHSFIHSFVPAWSARVHVSVLSLIGRSLAQRRARAIRAYVRPGDSRKFAAHSQPIRANSGKFGQVRASSRKFAPDITQFRDANARRCGFMSPVRAARKGGCRWPEACRHDDVWTSDAYMPEAGWELCWLALAATPAAPPAPPPSPSSPPLPPIDRLQYRRFHTVHTRAPECRGERPRNGCGF
eukprot:7382204-Prymnesium_polylepis.1